VKPDDRVALNISSAVGDGDQVNVVDDTKDMLDRFKAVNQPAVADAPTAPPTTQSSATMAASSN
jgi:hypothetical protein